MPRSAVALCSCRRLCTIPSQIVYQCTISGDAAVLAQAAEKSSRTEVHDLRASSACSSEIVASVSSVVIDKVSQVLEEEESGLVSDSSVCWDAYESLEKSRMDMPIHLYQ